jgi:hypothetical protein
LQIVTSVWPQVKALQCERLSSYEYLDSGVERRMKARHDTRAAVAMERIGLQGTQFMNTFRREGGLENLLFGESTPPPGRTSSSKAVSDGGRSVTSVDSSTGSTPSSDAGSLTKNKHPFAGDNNGKYGSSPAVSGNPTLYAASSSAVKVSQAVCITRPSMMEGGLEVTYDLNTIGRDLEKLSSDTKTSSIDAHLTDVETVLSNAGDPLSPPLPQYTRFSVSADQVSPAADVDASAVSDADEHEQRRVRPKSFLGRVRVSISPNLEVPEGARELESHMRVTGRELWHHARVAAT